MDNSPLLALTAQQLELFPLISCALLGVSVFILFWWVFRALASGDLAQGDEWRYDVNRINELRRADAMFRLFQPLIQFLARLNQAAFTRAMPKIQHDIHRAGLPRFWLAAEYLGRCEVIALLLLPVYLFIGLRLFGGAGAISALGMVVLTAWFLRWRLKKRADYRLVNIKRRMPFLLDLLTLLMEAGTNFLQALEQAVREFEGHPVAQEFGRVLADMNMGKTRTEAFESMQERLNDDEVTSIIGSIIQGENLGSPLAQVFRTQADVLRLKRTQRAETLAGEAGVNMLLPGVLVMLSTVIVILGPFVLQFVFSGIL